MDLSLTDYEVPESIEAARADPAWRAALEGFLRANHTFPDETQAWIRFHHAALDAVSTQLDPDRRATLNESLLKRLQPDRQLTFFQRDDLVAFEGPDGQQDIFGWLRRTSCAQGTIEVLDGGGERHASGHGIMRVTGCPDPDVFTAHVRLFSTQHIEFVRAPDQAQPVQHAGAFAPPTLGEAWGGEWLDVFVVNGCGGYELPAVVAINEFDGSRTRAEEILATFLVDGAAQRVDVDDGLGGLVDEVTRGVEHDEVAPDLFKALAEELWQRLEDRYARFVAVYR